MDFDHPEAWQEKLGDYSATAVPAHLGWAERSPGILAALRRRKKRRWLLIWSSASAAFLVLGLGFYWFSSRTLGAFPIPLSGRLATAGALRTKAAAGSSPVQRSDRPVRQQRPLLAERQGAREADSGPKETDGDRVILTPLLGGTGSAGLATEAGAEAALLPLPSTLAIIAPLPIAAKPLLPWPASAPTFSPSPPAPRQSSWRSKFWAGPGIYFSNFGVRAPLAAETPLLGWQGGVVVQRPLHRSWQLITGITGVTRRQKVNYAATTPVMLYRPNTLDSILVNAWNGQETLIYRDSVAGRRTRRFQHYNQQHWLQVPLAIGWGRQYGRWQMDFQAGAALNVLVNAQGRTLDQAGAVIELANGNWYRRQPTLSWQIGWNGQWRLSPRWQIGALVIMDQSLHNQLAPSSGLEQKLSSIFSGLSIRCEL